MQFVTPILIPRNPISIDYNSTIVSFGSCFAENMGDKFEYFKFQSTINPFGIIFNPVAIERIIERIVNQEFFTDEDIFFHNERWHSFDVHSDLSNENKQELLENLNQQLKTTKQKLKEATHIIITYGTSWVYRNIEKNAIVANCHKVTQKEFTKELLSVAVIKESITNTIHLIESLNPDVSFIFTISPVRHIKDGFVENQISKAHLITAIHHSSYGIHHYFPSYEIMMDELRDYRFYANDMLHPSQIAIDYIWERFVASTIAENAVSVMDEVQNIQKSLSHKPFNPNSDSHKKFEHTLQMKITKLVAQYSFMKF